MTVACIGGAHVDISWHLLAPAVAGTSNPGRRTQGIGGVACNVARTLARLGVETDLVSVLGADPEGELVLAAASSDGVGTAGVTRTTEYPTAAYLAVLDPDGELVIGIVTSSIYESLGAAWALHTLEGISDAGLVVVDANLPPGVLETIVGGLADDVVVVANPVSVHKAVRLRPLAERIDVLFAGPEEAAVLVGAESDPADLAERLHRQGPSTVVVTEGVGGAVMANSGGVTHHRAVPASAVVDVTGAGDALVAGFVFSLVTGEGIAIRSGLAAASLAVEAATSVPSGLSRAALAGRISL